MRNLLFVINFTFLSEITVPRIVPSKLQLFIYTSLTVNCEGFFNNMTQWMVLRNVSGQTTPCNTNSSLFGPCHIPVAYPEESGEYWCESRDSERRSQSVYINITAGDVVLESPVRPVMVGDNVTLRCIKRENKKASTEFYFYKDGAEINTSPTGEMTIHNIVSKSDEGVYKCRSSEGRESEEQNLLGIHFTFLSGITVPRIVPSKLQLFNYASLTVNCEGFFNNMTQWKVLRNVSGQTTHCNTNSSLFGPCHIPVAYSKESGEYWCESRDPERRSESVRITVTEGDVVLESPVRPVMVGDDVTLRCIERGNKKASTRFYFYKDGAELNTSPTGEMTIHNISQSDQGLYKCSTNTITAKNVRVSLDTVTARVHAFPLLYKDVYLGSGLISLRDRSNTGSPLVGLVALPLLLLVFWFL
uniref:Ig-like domain-containing protein n=1 Tax=Neogobius melanostomus TaxID=47308 RepID=A0A8C6WIH5_9GOBI